MVEQWTFNPCVPGSNPGGRTMNNELNLYNELRIGDIVGTTKRMVIACTQTRQRVPDENFASWLAICVKEGEYHPYAVWDIIVTPNGFTAENGDYCFSLTQALSVYKKRGGQA